MKSIPLTLALLGFASLAQALTIGQSLTPPMMTDSKAAIHQLSDFAGKYVVLEWTNRDCPFVRKHYDKGNMQALQKKYTAAGVVWLTVISSAEGQQGYATGPQAEQIATSEGAAPSAIILDPSGELGRYFQAKTTPHMYIVSPQGALIYQGAIDSIRSVKPEDIEGARNHVAAALDEAMAGQEVSVAITQAYGCSIKYK